MRLIRTKSKPLVMVNDEDFQRLLRFKWYVESVGRTQYAYRKLKGSRYKTGITGRWRMSWDIIDKPKKGFIIDHIDGNGLNNQKYNLRVLTIRQNQQNRHSKASSKYPGVSKAGSRWVASVADNRKKVYLGTFDTEEEAFGQYQLYVLTNFSETVLLPEDNIIVPPDPEQERIKYLMKKDGYSAKEIEDYIALL